MTDLKSFIMKAKEEGKSVPQIVSEANDIGLELPRGGKIAAKNVYSMIAHERKMEKQSLPQRQVRRRRSMITIPVEEPSRTESPKGKVITIIADFEDVEKIIDKFIKGHAA